MPRCAIWKTRRGCRPVFYDWRRSPSKEQSPDNFVTINRIAPMPPTSDRDPGVRRGTVALLLWGNVFEDFLDGIGLTLDEFCERMPGGWGFGYVDALRSAGWRTILFCTS